MGAGEFFAFIGRLLQVGDEVGQHSADLSGQVVKTPEIGIGHIPLVVGDLQLGADFSARTLGYEQILEELRF